MFDARNPVVPTYISWKEIALRLVLTVIAGACIGFDRGEHGRAAGLRTVLLVCLAASVSMIQVNLLLPMTGKTPQSFAVMDLMRLPLGILSGMGFIGAGAIVRKDTMVQGVTTAATLWFVTVVGLCIGGGQIKLGMVALAIGMLVLEALRPIEKHWKQDHRATLRVVARPNGPSQDELIGLAEREGCEVRTVSASYENDSGTREFALELTWRTEGKRSRPPDFPGQLAGRENVLSVAWKP